MADSAVSKKITIVYFTKQCRVLLLTIPAIVVVIDDNVNDENVLLVNGLNIIAAVVWLVEGNCTIKTNYHEIEHKVPWIQ